ncbi:formin FRM2, partial [Cardiosporidium cionae]
MAIRGNFSPLTSLQNSPLSTGSTIASPQVYRLARRLFFILRKPLPLSEGLHPPVISPPSSSLPPVSITSSPSLTSPLYNEDAYSHPFPSVVTFILHRLVEIAQGEKAEASSDCSSSSSSLLSDSHLRTPLNTALPSSPYSSSDPPAEILLPSLISSPHLLVDLVTQTEGGSPSPLLNEKALFSGQILRFTLMECLPPPLKILCSFCSSILYWLELNRRDHFVFIRADSITNPIEILVASLVLVLHSKLKTFDPCTISPFCKDTLLFPRLSGLFFVFPIPPNPSCSRILQCFHHILTEDFIINQKVFLKIISMENFLAIKNSLIIDVYVNKKEISDPPSLHLGESFKTDNQPHSSPLVIPSYIHLLSSSTTAMVMHSTTSLKSAAFPSLCGDILIVLRYLIDKDKEFIAFFAFHTGFLNQEEEGPVLKLKKEDLVIDRSHRNSLSDDFSLTLVFSRHKPSSSFSRRPFMLRDPSLSLNEKIISKNSFSTSKAKQMHPFSSNWKSLKDNSSITYLRAPTAASSEFDAYHLFSPPLQSIIQLMKTSGLSHQECRLALRLCGNDETEAFKFLYHFCYPGKLKAPSEKSLPYTESLPYCPPAKYAYPLENNFTPSKLSPPSSLHLSSSLSSCTSLNSSPSFISPSSASNVNGHTSYTIKEIAPIPHREEDFHLHRKETNEKNFSDPHIASIKEIPSSGKAEPLSSNPSSFTHGALQIQCNLPMRSTSESTPVSTVQTSSNAYKESAKRGDATSMAHPPLKSSSPSSSSSEEFPVRLFSVYALQHPHVSSESSTPSLSTADSFGTLIPSSSYSNGTRQDISSPSMDSLLPPPSLSSSETLEAKIPISTMPLDVSTRSSLPVASATSLLPSPSPPLGSPVRTLEDAVHPLPVAPNLGISQETQTSPLLMPLPSPPLLGFPASTPIFPTGNGERTDWMCPSAESLLPPSPHLPSCLSASSLPSSVCTPSTQPMLDPEDYPPLSLNPSYMDIAGREMPPPRILPSPSLPLTVCPSSTPPPLSPSKLLSVLMAVLQEARGSLSSSSGGDTPHEDFIPSSPPKVEETKVPLGPSFMDCTAEDFHCIVEKLCENKTFLTQIAQLYAGVCTPSPLLLSKATQLEREAKELPSSISTVSLEKEDSLPFQEILLSEDTSLPSVERVASPSLKGGELPLRPSLQDVSSGNVKPPLALSNGSPKVISSKRPLKSPPPPPPKKGPPPKRGNPLKDKAAGLVPPPAVKKLLTGRKLHWKYLQSNSIEGTMFKEYSLLCEPLSDTLVHPETIIRLFTRKQNPKSAIMMGKQNIQADKKMKILNVQRAQNVAIILSRLRHPVETFVEKLISFDYSDISIEELEKLPSVLPTAEERSKFLEILEDKEMVEELRDVEKQLLPFVKINRISSRLRILTFACQWEEIAERVESNCRILQNAAVEARSCEKLHKVIASVLYFGNCINYGIEKGSPLKIYGFPISEIVQLLEFKTTMDSSINALHFILFILKHFIGLQLETLVDELPHLMKASSVSTETIISSLQQFEADVSFMIKYTQDEDFYDEATQKIIQLKELTSAKLQRIHAFYISTVGIAKEITIYFGEGRNFDKESFVSIFETLAKCVKILNKCIKEINEKPKKFDSLLPPTAIPMKGVMTTVDSSSSSPPRMAPKGISPSEGRGNHSSSSSPSRTLSSPFKKDTSSSPPSPSHPPSPSANTMKKVEETSSSIPNHCISPVIPWELPLISPSLQRATFIPTTLSTPSSPVSFTPSLASLHSFPPSPLKRSPSFHSGISPSISISKREEHFRNAAMRLQHSPSVSTQFMQTPQDTPHRLTEKYVTGEEDSFPHVSQLEDVLRQ